MLHQSLQSSQTLGQFFERLYTIWSKCLRTYWTPVRCLDIDAEPRFNGVDRSFPPAETSGTRGGVVGFGLPAFGGVGVRLSMIKSGRLDTELTTKTPSEAARTPNKVTCNHVWPIVVSSRLGARSPDLIPLERTVHVVLIDRLTQPWHDFHVPISLLWAWAW